MLGLAAGGAAAAAVFAAKALAPEAPVFRDFLTEGALLRLGGVVKLVFLTIGWRFAAKSASSLEASNPAHTPWRLFSLGLLAFAIGQAILSTYQVILGTSPYPSPGDVFFLAAYPLLVASTLGLIRAYRESGYPVGSVQEHALMALGASAVFVVLGVWLLRPIVAGQGRLIERLLTATYPAFDFVLLIPILLLLRIAAGFRGGRIFKAWGTLLAGIIFLCAGDILYAYLAVMGQETLDPLVDGTYVLAYMCVAQGTKDHYELLAA
jgi:hypothetical protein